VLLSLKHCTRESTNMFVSCHFSFLFSSTVLQNVRVISRYYTKIQLVRMSNLLSLDVDTTERYISDMVSDKEIHAKIDRPAGIVVFQKEVSKNADNLLNDWASSISSLLNLVETTCHLINKENMMHEMQ
jgi:26S proteasome regulatory subunit N5